MQTDSVAAIKEKPSLCYQCSKCSAGCPVSDEMDLLPHQIIHALSLGMEAEMLKTKTIWLCAGCYTCAVRCPNDIDITSVMDDLRAKAVKQGVPSPLPDVKKLHQTFINDISRRGRIHEVRLMAEYNIKKGRLFDNFALGPKMFFKGRLPLLPPKAVKGFKEWMGRIWKRAN